MKKCCLLYVLNFLKTLQGLTFFVRRHQTQRTRNKEKEIMHTECRRWISQPLALDHAWNISFICIVSVLDSFFKEGICQNSSVRLYPNLFSTCRICSKYCLELRCLDYKWYFPVVLQPVLCRQGRMLQLLISEGDLPSWIFPFSWTFIFGKYFLL